MFGYPSNVTTPPRRLVDVRRDGKPPSCGGPWGNRNGPNMALLAGDVPIDALVMYLESQLGARVIDRTGLTDRYNFIFEHAVDETAPGRSAIPDLPDPGADLDVPRAASVFTAIEEQLGLRLERAQALREFIVIDHIERPQPN
jgi:uncharacterized protein (TIGR03435 family)